MKQIEATQLIFTVKLTLPESKMGLDETPGPCPQNICKRKIEIREGKETQNINTKELKSVLKVYSSISNTLEGSAELVVNSSNVS
jgi:hypothetical protein